jgi:hypothetical protein
MDTEKMLFTLSEGKPLLAEEIAEVTELLEGSEGIAGGRGFSVDDVYSCLLVVGRGKLFDYRHVVEQYLQAEDALTVALVLEMLCLDWGFVEEYLEQVISFALGVPWDEDEDVRQTALKILGEYLFASEPSRRDKAEAQDEIKLARRRHVLDLLVCVFQDEAAEQWTRQASYYALCRAYGKKWEEIPPECVMLDLKIGSADLDQKVLDYVAQFLPGKSSSEKPSSSAD